MKQRLRDLDLAALLARWTVERPVRLAIAGILVMAICLAILSQRSRFDTDILNLLPADRLAVQGLKEMNSAFAQAKELTFVVQHDDALEAEAIYEQVAERLRQEPWVLRILDGSPFESPEGRHDLEKILVPLLLNLPPEDFRRALEQLDPQRVSDRLNDLQRKFEAGSPGAIAELSTDPLGLLAAAVQPLTQTAIDTDSLAVRSPDGRTLLIPVITNQPTLSAEDCQALMASVRHFIADQVASFEREGASLPKLLVTGRSAYVDEISRSMERDIRVTSVVSLLAVTLLFWIAFRRVVPLLGVALLLGCSAVVALAIGSLLFLQLNVIAIGFCSILFGLGDDFGLLLFEGFNRASAAGGDRKSWIASAIRETFPGIGWVALTTAVGFLALGLSDSTGFAQLGTMVAIGVAACAVILPTFIFLWIRRPAGNAVPTSAGQDSSPLCEIRGSSPLRNLGGPCGELTLQVEVESGSTRSAPLAFGAVLIALAVVAVVPWRPLAFDTSPTSLEPRNTPAARALQTILNAFPESYEPVAAIVRGENQEQTLPLSTWLGDRLTQLRARGVIERFASPSSLLLSKERMRHNASQLPASISITAIRDAIEERGLNAAAFSSSLETLQSLERARNQLPVTSWSRILPPTSPLWFLIDRLVSPDGKVAAAFIKPAPAHATAAAAPALERSILADLPQKHDGKLLVTGWTQTLGSLVPWAQRQLALFGSAVAIVILLILAVVYRNWRLWGIHAAGLGLALAATVATLKLAQVQINLLNVLAFPLMLAVGVDYGVHLLLATMKGHVESVVRPVLISGLTTVIGFASLTLASNPSLNGLGLVCAIGVGWSLATSFLFVSPLGSRVVATATG